MESTNAHETTATTTAAAGADVDLISDLNDDLLLRILAFLPAANDVARTTVLSSRWRHLWSAATALRFNVGRNPKVRTSAAVESDARRLIAAADAAVTQRAGGPDVEDLEISFIYASDDSRYLGSGAANMASAHVAAWLRFASRRVTGRFKLALPWRRPLADKVLLGELPSSVRVKEMSLTLGKAIVSVPVAGAGAFPALTDLVLSDAQLHAGAGDDLRLGHLLSSLCCPRLRRLQITCVDGLAALHLDMAGTLEELRLGSLYNLVSLEVHAPGLRVLGVEACLKIVAARISAPRLEVLATNHIGRKERLVFDGVDSVRRIEGLELSSHRRRKHEEFNEEDDEVESSAAVWLLQHCTGLNWLGVEVKMPCWRVKMHEDLEEMYKDKMTDVPQLHSIRTVKIEVTAFGSGRGRRGGHNIGATVAKLIAKCHKIEFLSIDIWGAKKECSDLSCICDRPKDWDKQKLSLEHLKFVKIRNFVFRYSQIRLVQLLLVSAPVLERMVVKLDLYCLEDGEEVDFDLPCYGGRWVPYVWECSELGLFVRPIGYEWIRGSQGGE
ncbi:hypothetical protein ACP70R_018722 [Stipagrostis hirtigluma subsp. patula]